MNEADEFKEFNRIKSYLADVFGEDEGRVFFLAQNIISICNDPDTPPIAVVPTPEFLADMCSWHGEYIVVCGGEKYKYVVSKISDAEAA